MFCTVKPGSDVNIRFSSCACHGKVGAAMKFQQVGQVRQTPRNHDLAIFCRYWDISGTR